MTAENQFPINPAASGDRISVSFLERADLKAMFLPVRQMLQIDRVREINGTCIVCETDIAQHWVFPVHFPGDPIFPGSLLIEAAGQAVAIWAWHFGLRGKPRMAKVAATFESPLTPADRVLTLTGNIRLRRRLCLGTVDLLAGLRKIGKVESVIVIVPE